MSLFRLTAWLLLDWDWYPAGWRGLVSLNRYSLIVHAIQIYIANICNYMHVCTMRPCALCRHHDELCHYFLYTPVFYIIYIYLILNRRRYPPLFLLFFFCFILFRTSYICFVYDYLSLFSLLNIILSISFLILSQYR